MNAPVSWQLNWSFPFKYTCTLSTFKTSNILTIPATWCFAENDGCVVGLLFFFYLRLKIAAFDCRLATEEG